MEVREQQARRRPALHFFELSPIRIQSFVVFVSLFATLCFEICVACTFHPSPAPNMTKPGDRLNSSFTLKPSYAGGSLGPTVPDGPTGRTRSIGRARPAGRTAPTRPTREGKNEEGKKERKKKEENRRKGERREKREERRKKNEEWKKEEGKKEGKKAEGNKEARKTEGGKK